MFIPKEYEITDHAVVTAFIRRYNFGIIVTANDDVPIATHLPFHISEQDGKMVLSAHFARANTQWKGIEDKQVLVIFSQPHAYISPSLYDKEQNVPTWNYVAIHVYGKATIITDTEKGFGMLEQMMQQSEPAYMEQWQRLDEAYKTRLYKGIVLVEIEVDAVKAAGKLSQDKTTAEQQRIADTLYKSGDTAERDVAAYMK